MTPDADSELLGWDDSVSPPRLTMRGDWTLDNYAGWDSGSPCFAPVRGASRLARKTATST